MNFRRSSIFGIVASLAASVVFACGSAPLEEDLGTTESALKCGAGETSVCEWDPVYKRQNCECAPGLKCGPGKVQVGSECVACGKLNQPTCADNTCEPGTEGPSGYCRACGTAGIPACIWLAKCQPNLQVVNGICTPCGTRGAPVCNAGPACIDGMEPSQVHGLCGDAWGSQGQPCGEGGGCDARLECSPSNVCVPQPPRVPREDEGCGGHDESCCTDPIYTQACIGNRECKAQGWGGLGSNVCQDPGEGGYHPGGGGGTTTPACGTPKYECGSCDVASDVIVQRFVDTEGACSSDGSMYRVACTSVCASTKKMMVCGATCPNGWTTAGSASDPSRCIDNSGSTKVLCTR